MYNFSTILQTGTLFYLLNPFLLSALVTSGGNIRIIYEYTK